MTFKVILGGPDIVLALKSRQLSGPGPGVVLPITNPSSPGLQSLLQGDMTSHHNCVQSFSGRLVPPLADTRLQPLPSLIMRFLGEIQCLGDHCFNSLIAKGRVQVSLLGISSLLTGQWPQGDKIYLIRTTS